MKKTRQASSHASGKHLLQRLKTKKKVRWIIALAVVAVLVAVAVYEIYTLHQNPIQTMTAQEETVSASVRAEAFILRDEESFDVTLSDYAFPFVQDGDRVESNAAIAAKFPDAGSAQRFAQLQEMRAEYARYLALSTGREYSSMKVETLMAKAEEGMFAFLQQTDGGRILASRDSETDYLDRETALEIAVSGSIDLTDKLSELSQNIHAQEATVGAYETISTGVEAAGYYFSSADGYEDTLSYADAAKLTVQQIEQALAAKPAKVSGAKIVKNHAWYITAVVDRKTADTLADLKNQRKVRVRFPQSGVQDVKASVYALQKQSGDKCAVVLRCIEVDEALLCLRKVPVDIILAEYTGFKVPLHAIRVLEENGKQYRGVYILRSNIVSFRRLNTVYSEKDFVVTVPKNKENNERYGYVTVYDEIILGGKNLYDGELIY